jgi:monoamine oxidase
MSIPRRSLLQGAAAGLFLPGFVRAQPEKFDVVIVGAGLAGLNAALTLQSMGLRAVVLEATGRTGGRVHTLELPVGKANVGATTVGPFYARIRNIARELNVALVDPSPRSSMGNYVNGQLVAGADWSQSSANKTRGAERNLQPVQLEFGLVQPITPLKELDDWLKPHLIESLDIPYTTFLTDEGLSAEAVRLINVTTNVTDVRTASALGQLRDLHRMGWALGKGESKERSVYDPPKGVSHYVKGGTERLTDAMAAALEAPVRTEMPVAEIAQHKDGVTVTTMSGQRFEARYAIAAAPPPALKNIRFTPGLVGRHYDGVFAGVHSSTVHFFFAVKKPFWDNDIGEPALFADTFVERVFAHKDAASGEVTYLDCWINGMTAQQVDQLEPAHAAKVVEAHLAKIRPSTKGNIEFVEHFSWGRHPYIRGHRHEYGVGQIKRFANVFNEPHERIYFAGEHCRILEAGMEAAATSGERAAIEVIRKLS